MDTASHTSASTNIVAIETVMGSSAPAGVGGRVAGTTPSWLRRPSALRSPRRGR
ncbi:hypothetical protein I552_3718 [Mycobacterium xenopi 3993]|nr:hypothetical protein I552_3718 [Mycobacterium xenopi 3993]